MLRAFLGTFLIVFILIYYFLPKQKASDNKTQNTRSNLTSAKIAENKGLESVESVTKMTGDQSAMPSLKQATTVVKRKISSEELMEEFYKDVNNEKIVRNQKEQNFLLKHRRVVSEYYFKTQEEKWSVFQDVYITLDKDTESLLEFGPYRVTAEPKSDMHSSKLIYNEDKRVFVILTGRLIAKLKNLFDEEKISKDYGFKIDSVNPDIKTVYFKVDQSFSISNVRKLLSSDSRIDSFYFETVHNQWQKN